MVDRMPQKRTSRDDGYTFDGDAADKYASWFAKYLRHTKGEWAGKPFELAEWIKAFTRPRRTQRSSGAIRDHEQHDRRTRIKFRVSGMDLASTGPHS